MTDTLLTSILPYAVLGGIVASIIASLGLTTTSFLRRGQDRSDLLPRLNELEKAIRRDTLQIDLQLHQVSSSFKPDLARSVVLDLSAIAGELQKRASEVHRLLDELRLDRTISEDIDNKRRFVSLGLAVGQTENSIEAVVQRIEKKKQELNDL